MPSIDLSDPAAVEALVRRRHWEGGESIRAIERDLGLGKTTLNSACHRHGVAIRGQSEAASLHASEMEHPTGDDHWRAWKPEASARLAEQHSRRMTRDNPMSDPEARRKSARSRAETYRRDPSRHEAGLIDALHEAGVDFRFQRAIGPYIVDFAFPGPKLALELDGRGHASRRDQDAVRDRRLVEAGWTVVRCANSGLRNFRSGDADWHFGRLFSVLDDLVPDFDLVGSLPSGVEREYRVLARDAETPAGREA